MEPRYVSAGFWVALRCAKVALQVLELLVCVVGAAVFFAHQHRRELATAWVQWFFGLEARIEGAAQVQVEWRSAGRSSGGARTAAEGGATWRARVAWVVGCARARLGDGEFPVERLTARVRDVSLSTPGSGRAEELCRVDVLVVRLRFPSKRAAPEDDDPRGEAFCVVGVSAHTAVVNVVSYDGGMSDTSLQRLQRAVRDAFEGRRRKPSSSSSEAAAALRMDPVLLARLERHKRRWRRPVEAVLVTDRRGHVAAQPFRSTDEAAFDFATASPVYACVLFERRGPSSWEAVSSYGLDYAVRDLSRRALARPGGAVHEFSTCDAGPGFDAASTWDVSKEATGREARMARSAVRPAR